MDKKRVKYSIVFIVLLWLAMIGQLITTTGSTLTALLYATLDTVILSIYLIAVPLICRIKNKDLLDYHKGRKICVWNSIIACVISIMLSGVLDAEGLLGVGWIQALAYYFLNTGLFVKSEVDDGNGNKKSSQKSTKFLGIMIATFVILIVGFTTVNLISTAKETSAETQNDDGTYNAKHILVETYDEAEYIIALLNNGSDFEQLANEYSLDRETAIYGGELGEFEEGMMVQEFENAVKALKINQYTPVPIATDYGYHIILRIK